MTVICGLELVTDTSSVFNRNYFKWARNHLPNRNYIMDTKFYYWLLFGKIILNNVSHGCGWCIWLRVLFVSVILTSMLCHSRWWNFSAELNCACALNYWFTSAWYNENIWTGANRGYERLHSCLTDLFLLTGEIGMDVSALTVHIFLVFSLK